MLNPPTFVPKGFARTNVEEFIIFLLTIDKVMCHGIATYLGFCLVGLPKTDH